MVTQNKFLFFLVNSLQLNPRNSYYKPVGNFNTKQIRMKQSLITCFCERKKKKIKLFQLDPYSLLLEVSMVDREV